MFRCTSSPLVALISWGFGVVTPDLNPEYTHLRWASAFGRSIFFKLRKNSSARKTRLEFIFRRSPKKSFGLNDRSKSEISTRFFRAVRDGGLASLDPARST